MSDAPETLDTVVGEIRRRVTPEPAERERLAAVTQTLIDRAEAAVAELPVSADVIRVGSTARDTWLAGDRDIDIFVRFDPSLSRERLETHGLAVGQQVLPDGVQEYAEHPYVRGEYEEFAVDCVPCYRVVDATAIESAVDRTPFHNEYMQARLEERHTGGVRVVKALLKATGAYGADLRTRGFSGYLVELLVLEHGGAGSLIETAAEWEPPVRLDPESHGAASFDDPLVVIDPTDPRRNVAAACSASNLARFQHYSRQLLAAPSTAWFEPDPPSGLGRTAVADRVDRRGTHPVAIRFETPALVDDLLHPQLEKSLSSLEAELGRRGFDPLRASSMATTEQAVLLLECAVAERPAITRHQGPPVGVGAHAATFYETYADREDVTGPYIEDGRYVVERPREFRTPESFCASPSLFDIALGPDIADALEQDYEVVTGSAIAGLSEPFGAELAAYFDPQP